MSEKISLQNTDFSSIPYDMKSVAHWVCWRYQERDGKITKIPLDAKNGSNADTTDARTWASFECAYQSAIEHELFTGNNKAGWRGGIGFVFSENDNFCGIDLDHVIDDDGNLKDFAADIVNTLDSYTEYSPSRKGLHIFIKIKEPLKSIDTRNRNDKKGIEIYNVGRYFTVTGIPYGEVKPVAERTDVLKLVYANHFPPAKNPPSENFSEETLEITTQDASEPMTAEKAQALWDKIFNSEHGEKYKDLYDGDISDYITQDKDGSIHTDPSKADFVMCACLAKWTNCNARDIDYMFRQTRLMRSKWDERRGATTYGQRTINEAIESYKNDKKSEKKNERSVFEKRDEFLQGRHLLFHGSVRGGTWYAYNSEKGFWVTMTDADIQADVANHFGHREKTRSVTDIVTQCRFKVTEQIKPKFNTAPLMSFSNGVLELDTGDFRKAKPNDFLTWQVGYPYEEKATCENFDLFIQQISSGEQSRVNFLDDIGGYIMYPDCRLEKCFFLIGNGGNGKSVYLSVLDFIFSSVNPQVHAQSVSHIQPKDFKDPTKVIMLENSIVNIAYDIKPDLRGTEDTFKSLVSGEAITGNLKFHDTQSFITRAKLIASSNSMPIFDDNSAGLERRAMFVKLEKKFPRPDTGLQKKLFAEAPGIFNRFYRAYRALLEREKTRSDIIIRPSYDQTECLRDFKIAANTILEFWEAKGDEIKQTAATSEHERITKQDVYDKYCEWCKKTMTHPEQYNSFNRKFQVTLRGQNVPFQSVKSNGHNGDSGGSYKFTQDLPLPVDNEQHTDPIEANRIPF